MNKIRAFFAINTSVENQNKIADIQSHFKEIPSEVKWDSKDKFHITLKFLGDIDERILREMCDAVKLEIDDFPAFKISYKGIGGFPNIKFPRIIWIGCEGENNNIQELNKIVEGVAFNYNFPKEKNKFHQHITLGRVKGNKGLTEIIELITELKFETFNGIVESIDIIQSTLHPTGSVYKVLFKIPLKK